MESEDDMMTQRGNLKKIASLFSFTCVICQDWVKWKINITRRMYENKG